jgi:hypothetical protein
MTRRTLLGSAVLCFLVGVALSLVVWRPFGPESLTRAIVRECGVRAAPRGVERCSTIVDDALEIWYSRYYDGNLPAWAWAPAPPESHRPAWAYLPPSGPVQLGPPELPAITRLQRRLEEQQRRLAVDTPTAATRLRRRWAAAADSVRRGH